MPDVLLQQKINRTEKEINRRCVEFKNDKNKLPMEGKNSRLGHLEQIANKMRHL